MGGVRCSVICATPDTVPILARVPGVPWHATARGQLRDAQSYPSCFRLRSDAEDEGQEAYADVGPNAPITLPLVPPGERPPRAKGKPTFPELEPMVDALPQDAARGLGLGNA